MYIHTYAHIRNFSIDKHISRYICIHVYIYERICVHMEALYVHIYTYVLTYTYMYLYIHICTIYKLIHTHIKHIDVNI
jgi:hypothetical protein